MSEEYGLVPDAISRLASRRDGVAFLESQHVEAARRLTRLFERSQLRQRVTMSYDPARLGRTTKGGVQSDLADSAADARRRLNDLAWLLPADCWDVLSDICAFDQGLQEIESRRAWPRRGAKLVLRIALDQLCAIFGLEGEASGRQSGWIDGWLPERPDMFPRR